MTEVAKNLAEIKFEVESIEKARTDLQDESTQREALNELAISGMMAADKAEEIIERIKEIKVKLRDFQKQQKKGAN
jgi:hypothetical protein